MNEEVDKEILITKIFSRSLIWNRRLKAHSNRKAIHNAWAEISHEMGVAEVNLRKKWKYLKDQFAHELGRIEYQRANGTNKNIESQWVYFDSLLFLKGIIKPRTTLNSLIRKKKRPSDLESTETKITSHFNDSVKESYSVDESEIDDISDQEEFIELYEEEENASVTQSPYSNFENKNKRPTCNLDRNQAKKGNISEISYEQSKEENDDLLFFRSLLPFVHKIPENMKLRFRSKVMVLVEEFANSQNSLNSTFVSVERNDAMLITCLEPQTLTSESPKFEVIKSEF